MTPEDLIGIGERLYGRWGWQKRLAEDLGGNENTIRRWKTGHSPIGPDVAARIRRLAARLNATPEAIPLVEALDVLMTNPTMALRFRDGRLILTGEGRTDVIVSAETENG